MTANNGSTGSTGGLTRAEHMSLRAKWPRILKMLAAGKSLARVCAKQGFPSLSTVKEWCKADPDWQADYTRAREAAAAYYGHKVGEVGTLALAGKRDANAARVAIDAYKWTAGKLDRGTWGDEVRLEVDGGPVMIFAGLRPKPALAEVLDTNVIEQGDGQDDAAADD